MSIDVDLFQWLLKHLLNEDNASGGCHGFLIVHAQLKIRTQLRQGEIDYYRLENTT